VTGAVGFVYLACWLRFYDSPERQPRLSAEERAYILSARPPAGAAASLSIWQAFRHPVAIGFCLARFLTDSLSYFFSFWLPDYLGTARGFTLGMIGLLGWIPFLAADVGGPGGGALSDWLVRRGWASYVARRRVMLMAALLMPLALVAVRVDSAYVALGLIAVLLAAQSCWNSNLFTLMSELFPREHVATFVAASAIGGSLGGILSTLVAGQVIHGFGYTPVFTVLGLVHLLAFGTIQFSLRQRAAPAG
jgi:ACS family hexuronate transporter-like MFS transporter